MAGLLGGRKGGSFLEFTLVGIPLIFVFISFFELARGMWMYHTLAYAVREGTRYASVHGRGCASPNACQVTVGQIASQIVDAGKGLDNSTTTLSLIAASGSTTTGTISTLLANSTIWPPSSANAPGLKVKIAAVYPFRSILAMLWPGAGGMFGGFKVFYLRASSQELIKF